MVLDILVIPECNNGQLITIILIYREIQIKIDQVYRTEISNNTNLYKYPCSVHLKFSSEVIAHV